MSNLSVLVVDDEKDIREMLKFAFLARGFQVRMANNGAEALKAISEAMPSMMVLDLMMPQMTGYEVVASLRDEGILETLPVTILTARNLDDTDYEQLSGVRYIYQKGATDVMSLVGKLAQSN